MLLASATSIITAVGVASSAVLAGVAAVIAALNRRSIRTDSGDRIGSVAERTHDMVAVNELRHQLQDGEDGRTET